MQFRARLGTGWDGLTIIVTNFSCRYCIVSAQSSERTKSNNYPSKMGGILFLQYLIDDDQNLLTQHWEPGLKEVEMNHCLLLAEDPLCQR